MESTYSNQIYVLCGKGKKSYFYHWSSKKRKLTITKLEKECCCSMFSSFSPPSLFSFLFLFLLLLFSAVHHSPIIFIHSLFPSMSHSYILGIISTLVSHFVFLHVIICFHQFYHFLFGISLYFSIYLIHVLVYPCKRPSINLKYPSIRSQYLCIALCNVNLLIVLQ